MGVGLFYDLNEGSKERLNEFIYQELHKHHNKTKIRYDFNYKNLNSYHITCVNSYSNIEKSDLDYIKNHYMKCNFKINAYKLDTFENPKDYRIKPIVVLANSSELTKHAKEVQSYFIKKELLVSEYSIPENYHPHITIATIKDDYNKNSYLNFRLSSTIDLEIENMYLFEN